MPLPDLRKPMPLSPAARQRRMLRQELAPYMSNLAQWHSQAARLQVELARAAGGKAPRTDTESALAELLGIVRGAADDFAEKAATLPQSTRVDDVRKAFARLRDELESAAR